MAVHKSGEDYLEAILMIQEARGACRSIDVARRLGVSKPSVSVAMGHLRDEGMVVMDQDGFLWLTEPGRAIAEEIYTRHRVLTDFFRSIGVPPQVAEEDACKIEHDLSGETFRRLKEYIQSASN